MSDEERRLLKHLQDQRNLTAFQAQMVATNCGSRLIVGDYLIESQLGAGYYGECYVASSPSAKERISLRVFSPEFSKQDGLLLKYFIRKSKAVPAPKGFQKAIATGLHSGRVFLVSEFVEGESLECLVNRLGPFSIVEALRCISTIVDHWLHDLTSIATFGHLRPSKILVANNTDFCIRDTAIAYCLHERKQSHKTPLMIPLLPADHVAYMAPEVVLGTTKPNRLSDIYALGCLFYFLLTGEPVFMATNGAAVAEAVLSGTIPSLGDRVTGLPDSVQSLFSWMVCKNPNDRINSLETCQECIGRILSGVRQNSEASKRVDRPTASVPSKLATSASSRPTTPAMANIDIRL